MTEPAWRLGALCAQIDPEAFFPEKGASSRDAKAICRNCDVRTECLAYALEQDERFGVWGGLSERERRTLRRKPPQQPRQVTPPPRPRKPIPHGTHSGYNRGCHCLACRTAERHYQHQRQLTRGA